MADHTKFVRFAAHLRSRPGTWVLYPTGLSMFSVPRTVEDINTGKRKVLPVTEFEARVHEGRCYVRARKAQS